MKSAARKFSTLFIVLVLVAAVWVYFNWRNRYVWPKQVSWMQDLPPEDRSAWPREPVAFSNETYEIQVITPEGYKTNRITHSVNSIGMKFVRLEPGTFYMGLTPAEARRMGYQHINGHWVTLTKPYLLGICEVSNKEYEQFDPKHERKRAPIKEHSEPLDHPVEGVTWREANEFCRWLSAREGKQYRLPTEAEWEYACRAGTRARTYWGDAVWDANMAKVGGLRNNEETWQNDNWTFSAPVGLFPPNPWGFHDMIGNAREWVADWYERYGTNSVTDPVGPPNLGRFRVIKGVGWSTRHRHITMSNRDGNNPADLHDLVGFRVLCEIPAN
jgi:sulfatase modifying factor 1